MDYVSTKLKSLSYIELSNLIIVLKNDNKIFLKGLVNYSEVLSSLTKMALNELKRRADLIPSEKLFNDLTHTLQNGKGKSFNFKTIWSFKS